MERIVGALLKSKLSAKSLSFVNKKLVSGEDHSQRHSLNGPQMTKPIL